MLLLGRTVLAFCVSLPLAWELCTGQDMGQFGVSFFEQWAGYRLLSEKVTWPHVRADRPILIPSVPVSEGIEIRHGCQFISSLVRALAKLLGGVGRFLPSGVVSHTSRLRHLGWNQCSHGLTSRPLESCHHQCLKAACGVLGYPKGSASELLDGTWKLRHCTTLFTMRFPSPPPPHTHTRSLPRVGNDGGIRCNVTPGHLSDDRSNVVKRVRLTRKTRPSASSHVIPDPGHPTPRRWKRLRLLPPKEWGVRWACLAIFFLDLGLGEVCTGDAWNVPSEGTGVVACRLVSPAEGTGALAPVRFNWMHCACAWTDIRTLHTVRTTTTTKSTRLTRVELFCAPSCRHVVAC